VPNVERDIVPLADFHPVHITVKQEDDAVLCGFTLSRLTDEENIEELGRELFLLVDQLNFQKIAISMKGVEYVTSSVLGKLISLHRKLHRSGGLLVLHDAGSALSEILRTSHLLEYFRIAETADDARRMLNTEDSGADD
jgi:anti-sigma B factor antagonist